MLSIGMMIPTREIRFFFHLLSRLLSLNYYWGVQQTGRGLASFEKHDGPRGWLHHVISEAWRDGFQICLDGV